MTESVEAWIAAWAAESRLSADDRKQARDLFRAHPGDAWRTLRPLIAANPDEAWKLGELARLLLDVCDETTRDTIVAEARSNDDVAAALTEAMLFPETDGDLPPVYAMIGRESFLQAFIRGANDRSFVSEWTGEIVDELVRHHPQEALPILADAIAVCAEDAIAAIAAGPLEDVIKQHGAKVIEAVERYAAADERFRRALSGVWLFDVDRDLFDRIDRAAAQPIDRPRWGGFGAASPDRGPRPDSTAHAGSLDDLVARLADAGIDCRAEGVFLDFGTEEKGSYETPSGFVSITVYRSRDDMLAAAGHEQAPALVLGENWIARMDDTTLAARIAAATGGAVWNARNA